MEITNTYLKHLHVDNYKSLKNSELELREGLNIIIGKNGAGKSNLLDFIYRYAGNLFNLRDINVLPEYFVSLCYYADNVENILSCTVRRGSKKNGVSKEEDFLTYEVILNKTENNKQTIKDKKIEVTGHVVFGISEHDNETINEIQVFGSLKKKYITFELPDNLSWLSKPNKLTIEINSRFESGNPSFSLFRGLEFEIQLDLVRLSEARKNASSLKERLNKILNDYLKRSTINEILTSYTPIHQIRFNPNLSIYINENSTIVENLSIDFLIDGEWTPWSSLSDGTKRLFHLISECLSIDQGIILIEEPELGIHPHQLLKVLEFLKDQSKNKQVIISTHSPQSLDILNENELDRIIIAEYDRGTKFYRLTKEETDKAKRYISEVGELSYYWLHSDLEK